MNQNRLSKNLLSIGAAGLLSVGILASAIAAPRNLGVKARKVSGDVKVKIGKTMSPLREGMVIQNGSSITTGKDGTVILVWETGHVLKVGPLSATSIKATTASGSENTVLKLDKGSVFARAAKLQNKGSKLEIETPTTIAGVRGTSFEVSQEGKATLISTIRGIVAVRMGKGKETQVPAGKQGSAEKGTVKTSNIPDKKLDLLRQADALATSIQSTSIRGANPDAGDKVEAAVTKAVDAQVENAILDSLSNHGSGGVRFHVR